MPAPQRRQLNVPVDSALADALKSRAAQEGVTLSHLVQQLLIAAMEGWSKTPDAHKRLDDHEQRLTRLENHPVFKTKQP